MVRLTCVSGVVCGDWAGVSVLDSSGGYEAVFGVEWEWVVLGSLFNVSVGSVGDWRSHPRLGGVSVSSSAVMVRPSGVSVSVVWGSRRLGRAGACGLGAGGGVVRWGRGSKSGPGFPCRAGLFMVRRPLVPGFFEQRGFAVQHILQSDVSRGTPKYAR